ncbi:MAG: hypothetical protein ACPGOU_01225 [Candidatus Nanopelagicales bacterium]
MARPGGRCCNTMLVNEFDVDVMIRYLHPETGTPEAGWNKFSIRSIRTWLDAHPQVTNVRFVKHTMSVDIPRREDPMRSWTERDRNGGRILWNGLGMEISVYHILFDRN